MKKYSTDLFLFLGIILLMTACSEEPVDENIFGSLSGKVVAKADNTPLVNVKVTSNPVSNTVFTDGDGNFEISAIQVGEYSFQAELADFQTAFEPAIIVEGQSVTIVFELDSLQVNNSAPQSPLLLFPKDGVENIGSEVQFAWSSSANDDDEIIYSLELRNGATNEIKLFEGLRDTTLVIDNLSIGKNYFWQISADDGVNTIVKSALGSFATNDAASNRFLYVRNVAGNNVLFSGSERIDDNEEGVNQNEIQLTSSTSNCYRPAKNNTVNKIAFLRSVGAATHLFVINADGTNMKQVTSTISLAGFKQDELEYTWAENGAKLYFPNFNKLYAINPDGSGIALIYELENEFISEVAVNPINDLVLLKTNDVTGYHARIIVVDLAGDAVQEVVASQVGALGGIDFSADGTKVLFTRDVSQVENVDYRQLDSRIFVYDLLSDTTTEIDTGKEAGTNDLDAKYAPDDGAIIFVNTSNDGISERRIYRTTENVDGRREVLFTNAFMPNWE